jgi:hypothetical protein
METAQLGDLALVSFAATRMSEGKCGCPAAMSAPSSS